MKRVKTILNNDLPWPQNDESTSKKMSTMVSEDSTSKTLSDINLSRVLLMQKTLKLTSNTNNAIALQVVELKDAK